MSRSSAVAVPTAAPPSANIPFHRAIELLRAVDLCATCGKTRVLINVARRGFVAEAVSADTHCACVGGPAYAGIGSTIRDAEVVEFDGARTTYGALMSQDRKLVSRDADGVLRGSYPL